MPNYDIRSASADKTLFSGQFHSFAACVEAAIAKNISLAGADFSNTNLSNAEMDGGNYAGADFSGSNLTGANLSEADLRGCDFSNAILHGTVLCHSDLSHSQFDGALFGATDIAGATLLECIFSTLSVFTLPFDEVDMMRNCRFINPCGMICQFSRQPMIIRGLSAPVYIMDQHIKIGHAAFPLDGIPAWISSGSLNPRNLRLRLEQILLALIMDDKRPKIA